MSCYMLLSVAKDAYFNKCNTGFLFLAYRLLLQLDSLLTWVCCRKTTKYTYVHTCKQTNTHTLEKKLQETKCTPIASHSRGCTPGFKNHFLY